MNSLVRRQQDTYKIARKQSQWKTDDGNQRQSSPKGDYEHSAEWKVMGTCMTMFISYEADYVAIVRSVMVRRMRVRTLNE